mgnify:CR=1 FL=1
MESSIIQAEDLSDAERQEVLRKYPGLRLPSKGSDVQVSSSTASSRTQVQYKGRKKGVRSRRLFRTPDRRRLVYPVIGLIGLLGSLCLGLGWLVTETGQAIWVLGKRMHEDKWRIK